LPPGFKIDVQPEVAVRLLRPDVGRTVPAAGRDGNVGLLRAYRIDRISDDRPFDRQG
jgi:hypothetical protein